MKNTDKLQETILNATYILIDAYEKLACINGIHLECKNIKDASISFLEKLCWTTLILNLSKLYIFKDNENYNLDKLIKNIRKEKDGFGLSISQIERFGVLSDRFENIIKSDDFKNKIESLKLLRDKFFAHTDYNRFDFLDKININENEIADLLSSAEFFLVLLYEVFLDRSLVFDKKFSHVDTLIKMYNKGVKNYSQHAIDNFLFDSQSDKR